MPPAYSTSPQSAATVLMLVFVGLVSVAVGAVAGLFAPYAVLIPLGFSVFPGCLYLVAPRRIRPLAPAAAVLTGQGLAAFISFLRGDPPGWWLADTLVLTAIPFYFMATRAFRLPVIALTAYQLVWLYADLAADAKLPAESDLRPALTARMFLHAGSVAWLFLGYAVIARMNGRLTPTDRQPRLGVAVVAALAMLLGTATMFSVRGGLWWLRDRIISAPPDWREFTVSDGRFTVTMPGEWVKGTETIATRNGPAEAVTYQVAAGRAWYSVAVADLPPFNPDALNPLFQPPAPPPNDGTTLEWDKPLSEWYGVSVGTKLIRTSRPPGFILVRECVDGDRVIELRVVGPDSQREAAMRFIDSFRPSRPVESVGRVAPFLAAVVSPDGRSLLCSTRDWQLKRYSLPDLKETGVFRLTHRPVELLAHPTLGLLVCRDESGSVVIYNARNTFAGAADGEPKLVELVNTSPRAIRAALSPDGQWLYFLTCENGADVRWGLNQMPYNNVWKYPPKGVKLWRTDMASRRTREALPLADGTEEFAFPPNGHAVYATATPRGHEYWRGHGSRLDKAFRDDPDALVALNAERPLTAFPMWRDPLEGLVQIIDPKTFRLNSTITVDADPFGLAVNNNGLVYLSGGSDQHTELTVVDGKAGKVIGPWHRSISMFAPIRLTPDGHLLVLRPHSTPRSLEFYWVGDDPTGTPRQQRRVWSHETDTKVHPVGEFVISPDGATVFDDEGQVIRLGGRQAGN